MGSGLEMLGVGGLGYHLFSLPPELYNYIMRLAVMPPPGPINGLNAVFYEATLRCWASDECVAFLGACDNVDDFKRLHRTLNAMRHATNQACGADNAAWKRALTAYKSYYQKHQNRSAKA